MTSAIPGVETMSSERTALDDLLIESLRDLVAAQEAKIAVLQEALTPSGDTKAAYIGEFSFDLEHEGYDADGEPLEGTKRVPVPWTTVKEIMAAIRERAKIAVSA